MAIRKTKTRRASTTRKPATRKAATRKTATRKVSRPWTRAEMSFMRKYYRKFETAWCARQLGRTVYSVRYKAVDLSLKKASPSVWRGNKGPANAYKAFGKSSKPTARKAATRRTATKGRSYKATAKKRTPRKATTKKRAPRKATATRKTTRKATSTRKKATRR